MLVEYPEYSTNNSKSIFCTPWVAALSLLSPGPSQWRITITECVVNYQLLAAIYWSSPNVELLVEVDHNQLLTMASQTVDPIDWSHPPTSWVVPPERLVPSINRCSSATAGILDCNLATLSLACWRLQGYNIESRLWLNFGFINNDVVSFNGGARWLAVFNKNGVDVRPHSLTVSKRILKKIMIILLSGSSDYFHQ